MEREELHDRSGSNFWDRRDEDFISADPIACHTASRRATTANSADPRGDDRVERWVP